MIRDSTAMYTLEEIDARNITYRKAFEIARVRASSLAEDLIHRALFSEKQRVDSRVLPPFAEFEKLQEKSKIFQDRVTAGARRTYASYLGDPRQRCYALVNDTKTVVGVAQISLPSYVDPGFKVPLLQWLYSKWLGGWYKLLSLFSPMVIKPIIDEYQEGSRLRGINTEDKDARVAELSKLPTHELEKIEYPDKGLTYYLDVFGIRTDFHGKQLGRKLLEGLIEKLKAEAVKPPTLNGPAKLQWEAAPEARGFYRRLGCTECSTVVSERGFEHTGFFLNLD